MNYQNSHNGSMSTQQGYMTNPPPASQPPPTAPSNGSPFPPDCNSPFRGHPYQGYPNQECPPDMPAPNVAVSQPGHGQPLTLNQLLLQNNSLGPQPSRMPGPMSPMSQPGGGAYRYDPYGGYIPKSGPSGQQDGNQAPLKDPTTSTSRANTPQEAVPAAGGAAGDMRSPQDPQNQPQTMDPKGQPNRGYGGSPGMIRPPPPPPRLNYPGEYGPPPPGDPYSYAGGPYAQRYPPPRYPNAPGGYSMMPPPPPPGGYLTEYQKMYPTSSPYMMPDQQQQQPGYPRPHYQTADMYGRGGGGGYPPGVGPMANGVSPRAPAPPMRYALPQGPMEGPPPQPPQQQQQEQHQQNAGYLPQSTQQQPGRADSRDGAMPSGDQSQQQQQPTPGSGEAMPSRPPSQSSASVRSGPPQSPAQQPKKDEDPSQPQQPSQPQAQPLPPPPPQNSAPGVPQYHHFIMQQQQQMHPMYRQGPTANRMPPHQRGGAPPPYGAPAGYPGGPYPPPPPPNFQQQQPQGGYPMPYGAGDMYSQPPPPPQQYGQYNRGGYPCPPPANPQQQPPPPPQQQQAAPPPSQAPTQNFAPLPPNLSHQSASCFQRLLEMGYEPERRQWLEHYFFFMEEINKPLTGLPQVVKQPLDLYRFYLAVRERGGVLEVIKTKRWKEISQLFNINASASAAFTLRKNYCKYLLDYECRFDHGPGGMDARVVLAQIEGLSSKKKKLSVGSIGGAGSEMNESSTSSSTPFPPPSPVGSQSSASSNLMPPGSAGVSSAQQQPPTNGGGGGPGSLQEETAKTGSPAVVGGAMSPAPSSAAPSPFPQQQQTATSTAGGPPTSVEQQQQPAPSPAANVVTTSTPGSAGTPGPGYPLSMGGPAGGMPWRPPNNGTGAPNNTARPPFSPPGYPPQSRMPGPVGGYPGEGMRHHYPPQGLYGGRPMPPHHLMEGGDVGPGPKPPPLGPPPTPVGNTVHHPPQSSAMMYRGPVPPQAPPIFAGGHYHQTGGVRAPPPPPGMMPRPPYGPGAPPMYPGGGAAPGGGVGGPQAPPNTALIPPNQSGRMQVTAAAAMMAQQQQQHAQQPPPPQVQAQPPSQQHPGLMGPQQRPGPQYVPPQQAQAAAYWKRMEPVHLFPPGCVESTPVDTSRRKRFRVKDLGPVTALKLVMALRSGLPAETTWALNALNVILRDEPTVLEAYFAASAQQPLLAVNANAPTLTSLVTALTDHLRFAANELFPRHRLIADLELPLYLDAESSVPPQSHPSPPPLDMETTMTTTTSSQENSNSHHLLQLVDLFNEVAKKRPPNTHPPSGLLAVEREITALAHAKGISVAALREMIKQLLLQGKNSRYLLKTAPPKLPKPAVVPGTLPNDTAIDKPASGGLNKRGRGRGSTTSLLAEHFAVYEAALNAQTAAQQVQEAVVNRPKQTSALFVNNLSGPEARANIRRLALFALDELLEGKESLPPVLVPADHEEDVEMEVKSEGPAVRPLISMRELFALGGADTTAYILPTPSGCYKDTIRRSFLTKTPTSSKATSQAASSAVASRKRVNSTTTTAAAEGEGRREVTSKRARSSSSSSLPVLSPQKAETEVEESASEAKEVEEGKAEEASAAAAAAEEEDKDSELNSHRLMMDSRGYCPLRAHSEIIRRGDLALWPVDSRAERAEGFALRCLCVSTALRNLSFVPSCERVLANHRALLALAGRLLMVAHTHFDSPDADWACVEDHAAKYDSDSAWWMPWLDELCENILVLLVNISGHLRCLPLPESIVRPLLEGLIHWTTCQTAAATDPLPGHRLISPCRLALEALNRLSVDDGNVAMILATMDPESAHKLFDRLATWLALPEDQITRELALSTIHYLSEPPVSFFPHQGDGGNNSGNGNNSNNSLAYGLSLLAEAKPCPVAGLVAFIEVMEAKTRRVIDQLGVHALQDQPELMGTSLDLLRRAGALLERLAANAFGRSRFTPELELRVLSLATSGVLDATVAQLLSGCLLNLPHRNQHSKSMKELIPALPSSERVKELLSPPMAKQQQQNSHQETAEEQGETPVEKSQCGEGEEPNKKLISTTKSTEVVATV